MSQVMKAEFFSDTVWPWKMEVVMSETSNTAAVTASNRTVSCALCYTDCVSNSGPNCSSDRSAF
jgi:hypothetical protein